MWRLRYWLRAMTTAGVCRHCGCVQHHATNPATLRVDPDVLVCPHCDTPSTAQCKLCSQMLKPVTMIVRKPPEGGSDDQR